AGHDSLRIQVNFNPASNSYSVQYVDREPSGTDALLARAMLRDPIGSYKGAILDANTGEPLFHSASGTGAAFRLLTRALTFRFPLASADFRFQMSAENPESGRRETVVDELISLDQIGDVA